MKKCIKLESIKRVIKMRDWLNWFLSCFKDRSSNNNQYGDTDVIAIREELQKLNNEYESLLIQYEGIKKEIFRVLTMKDALESLIKYKQY